MNNKKFVWRVVFSDLFGEFEETQVHYWEEAFDYAVGALYDYYDVRMSAALCKGREVFLYLFLDLLDTGEIKAYIKKEDKKKIVALGQEQAKTYFQNLLEIEDIKRMMKKED